MLNIKNINICKKEIICIMCSKHFNCIEKMIEFLCELIEMN